MSAVTTISNRPVNHREESQKLLTQLLECVQRCQKRYGGKTELATEFDNCVASLCLTLEAVFLHGLRSKPLEAQSSSLKQVSEIISNSLNIGNETPSFWPFLKRHLTKHEQERYFILKHIWTDIGKCKAWIRSALNERSLERYFHVLLSNKDTVKIYYEDWALLRDDEKTSMLPNMAAGLCSILFAISIDKLEHNSNNSIQKLEKIKPKPEPIIEVPIAEPRKETKKKRKIAKQIISFDDEENILSSSVPSSSSSITSETNSNFEVFASKTNLALPLNMEEEKVKESDKRGNDNFSLKKTDNLTYKKPDNLSFKENHDLVHKENNYSSKSIPEIKKEKPVRKLSIETSGSRDKFSTFIEGTLTPVQSNIGELTPVSVEVNEESPNTSDDTVEIPMDISAVLTVCENRNIEEIKRLKEKVETLNKENFSLKEQLKKYINAVKMLKTDDVNAVKILQKEISTTQLLNMEENSSKKDVDSQTNAPTDETKQRTEISNRQDYKSEAKEYERKLVQVAEMHAELMNFNITLQQSICQKDTLIDRLKTELEELRGPMPTDELNVDSRNCVIVWIPSAFLTGSGSDSHHVYQIFLRAGADEWNIYRRYAQFYALHTDLKKLDPVVSTFNFPPKKSLGKKDSALVEDRRKKLQKYLRRVIAHWPELSQCNSRFLLEQHLAFFKETKEMDLKSNKKNTLVNRNNTASTSNNYAGL